MAHNLDTALLRSFVAVADTGSMTAAGNMLNVTQGAVSQQVRRLEDLVGARLLDRDRRGQRLTPAGERLVGKARALLALNDEILRDFSANSLTGRVRLGLPHDLAATVMATVVRAFSDAYPQVEVMLVCKSSPDLLASLGEGAIDLALVEQPLGEATGNCLSVERLVWVGAAGGTAYLKRPLPVSMVAETCAFRQAVLHALHERNLSWRTVFETGSNDATTAAVGTDLAVTAALESSVPRGLDVLGSEAGLPALPAFAITLHVNASARQIPVQALTQMLTAHFERPQTRDR